MDVMALTFSYGDYTLEPKPLFNLNKEYIKTPAGTGLGTRYNLTLEGNLLPAVSHGFDQSITGVFNAVESLRGAFDTDYKPFFLGCVGDDPIVSGHPKITAFDVNYAGDNYTQRASYSISLNLPTLVGTGFETVGPETDDLSSHGIISYSDDFSIEFTDERAGGLITLGPTFDVDGNPTGPAVIDFPSVYTVNHNVSAQGEPLSGFNPTTLAQNFVSSRLGWNNVMSGVSGIINASGIVCNNFRTVSVNQTEGTCNATETFVINPSGRYKEDFEVSANTSVEAPYISVDINGTIQGYASVEYPSRTGEYTDGDYNEALAYAQENTRPKIQNALGAWSGAVDVDGTTPSKMGLSGLLYSRANAFYQANPKHPAFLASSSLNPITLSTAVGYNITEGTITYAYSYDDRPINCVPEALTETINITENEPNDIFASLVVLGRASGPLLQDIGTKGPRTRDISIDAFLPIATGCAYTGMYRPSMFIAPTGYDAFVSGYENNLTSTYSGVYINSQSKTWQPKIGRFTYNKSWTVGDC